jgi:hypothetical protein
MARSHWLYYVVVRDSATGWLVRTGWGVLDSATGWLVRISRSCSWECLIRPRVGSFALGVGVLDSATGWLVRISRVRGEFIGDL